MNIIAQKIFQSIVNKLDSLLPVVDEDGNEITLQNDDKMTIRGMKKQIIQQFKRDLDLFRGDNIIQFPMVFDLLLRPEDYRRLEKGIPGLLPELISSFYGILKGIKDREQGTEIVNVNRYWLFSYGPSDFVEDKDGNTIPIPDGKVISQAALYGEDIRIVAKEPTQPEQNDNPILTRSSVTSVFSLTDGTAFNMDVLGIASLHSNRTISFNFDPQLNTDLKSIMGAKNASKNILALISWLSLNTMERSPKDFQMLEKNILISGTDDTRDNALGILKIKDGIVKIDHAQIQYDESKGEFQICAYYNNVRVGEKEVPVSEKQNPRWIGLPKKCSIVIGNSVTISFNGLK